MKYLKEILTTPEGWLGIILIRVINCTLETILNKGIIKNAAFYICYLNPTRTLIRDGINE